MARNHKTLDETSGIFSSHEAKKEDVDTVFKIRSLLRRIARRRRVALPVGL